MVKTKKIHPGVRQNATDWEHTEQYRQMLNELTNATNQVELTSEALSDAYMAYDNLGWAPLNGQYENGRGVPLRVLHDWTDMNQQLAAINPLIKRAVRIRVSNIFGEGIEFTDTRPRVQAFIEQNADLVFSPQAYEELETALATDGNVFFLLDKINKEVTRIPFREITNVAVKPGSIENKLYFERTWVESTTLDGMDGTYTKTQTRKTWYPAPEVLRTDLARRIRDVPVDGTKAVLHISVNKQIGWTWGVPDIQPVIFWAKAYKEYLESNYTLVRALAKFTWKVTNTTPRWTREPGCR